MFVQIEKTPNPNSLKFLPGRKVSEDGPYEILNKDETNNNLIRNILSINGIKSVFLGEDFLSINKENVENWENIQHIVISYINEYYAEGNDFKVISTFDFERFKPLLVSIEFNNYDFDKLLVSDIHALMKNNGYKLISKFGVTCFYVESKTSSNVHEIMRI